jgi:mRNA interferase MazF
VKRGDVVVVSLPGDFGKPRPAVIVQSDRLNEHTPTSFLLCPFTTELTDQSDVRVAVEPEGGNGLLARSEIMIEKVAPASVRRVGKVIGRLDGTTMRAVDRALVLVLGLA